MFRSYALGKAVVIGALMTLVISACSTGGTTATTSAGSDVGGECDTAGDATGISADAIKLGTFTPLSGPVAGPGQGAVEGQQFVFDRVNAEGGVQGRQIEFVALDDEYNPAIAQQQARRLVERDAVFAISGSVGTPNFVAVLPYIDEVGIPAIGPYAPAAGKVGSIDNPHVYMIWPSFVDEFSVLVDHIVGTEGATSIAMLMQTGDVGDDALAGTERALEKHGLELAGVVNTEATTTDYSSIAQELKNIGADWVITIVQPTGTGQAMEAMRKIGYTPTFASQSDLTDEGWVAAFGDVAEGTFTATKVAPLSTDDPIIQKFVTDFESATGKAPTMWNAVGYAQALVTVEALASAPALTRDCLEWSLQQMDGFVTGVIPPVSFGPEIRQGTSAVGLARIENGQVISVGPFQPIDG